MTSNPSASARIDIPSLYRLIGRGLDSDYPISQNKPVCEAVRKLSVAGLTGVLLAAYGAREFYHILKAMAKPRVKDFDHARQIPVMRIQK